MATTQEYAQLSLYVYNTTEPLNRPDLPQGWTELEYHPDNLLGMSYGVFQRSGTNEIVLAYTGSNETLTVDYVFTNLPAGLGLPSWQIPAAALIYQQVREKYGDNITLSGHSLGGGLASVMAVWFDRPAVVFDEAPFQISAANPVLYALTKAQLALAGYSDPAMAGILPDVVGRESHVTNYYLSGEILQSLRTNLTAVYGSTNAIAINVAAMTTLSDRVALHAQTFLTAAVMSESFRASTFVSTQIVPRILDEKLYNLDPQFGSERNFLVDLIRSERNAVVGQGKLTHFAADLNKLGTNISGLNQAAQDALIAQGIEWYYWQGTDYAGQEFFTQTGESLQYTIALGAGLAGAQNKAAIYAGKWLAPIVNDHGEFYSVSLARDYDQWNIAIGSSGASLTALKSDKSQIFIGGAGDDSFTGGDLGDVMFAGAGADTLDSGDGNDELYGGADNDTLKGGAGYDIYRIEGDDTIEDSDGIGSINDKSGQRITGAIEKRNDGSYVFLTDPTITVAGGADLHLTLADGSGVTIKNFQSGDLGLQLNDTTAPPETTRIILGDLAPIDFDPSTTGVQARIDDLGNIITDPDKPVPNQEDRLSDSAGNDLISGGDDRLDGGAGDDIVLGRDGDDIVIGGAGMDLLRGVISDDTNQFRFKRSTRKQRCCYAKNEKSWRASEVVCHTYQNHREMRR